VEAAAGVTSERWPGFTCQVEVAGASIEQRRGGSGGEASLFANSPRAPDHLRGG
jgi:hypothetical protein